MADLEDTRARRALIVELVRTRHVTTQGDLRDLLRAKGHDVTQATLSRDLAKLRARRVSLPNGGTAYEIEGFAARDEEGSQLSAMASLVLGIREGAAIVVVHTRPGAAQAVAAMLDQARLVSIIGSIAGDDTIFVVPERRVTTVALAKTLRRLLLPESAQLR